MTSSAGKSVVAELLCEERLDPHHSHEERDRQYRAPTAIPDRSSPARARETGSTAKAFGYDLFLLAVCLLGTFTIAGAAAAVLWKFLPGKAVAANPNDADAAPLDLVAYSRGQKLYSST